MVRPSTSFSPQLDADDVQRLALHHVQSDKRPIYIGVTTRLVERVAEHKEGVVPGFTKRYGLKHLAYYEGHDSIEAAIQREKTMKTWRRAWKVRLINEFNPA